MVLEVGHYGHVWLFHHKMVITKEPENLPQTGFTTLSILKEKISEPCKSRTFVYN